jgi:hypothetical protein
MHINNINFLLLFLSAFVGGLATALVLPIISYFFKRIMTKCQIYIEIENSIQSDMTKYVIFPLRLRNKSFVTLKNVASFVTISYEKEDILIHDQIQSYTVDTSDQPMMLSWAKSG